MAYYSPYQTSGVQANLFDLAQQARFGEQQSGIKTKGQMGKMTEEFEKELEAAQAAARKKSKKHGKLFKGLNIVGSLLGPLGAALTKGITALAQGSQQKKAMELLMNVDKKRFGKTFLKNPMKEYWQEAQDLQMSSGDVLRGGIGAGLTGFTMAKALGGDEGLGSKMFSKPDTLSSIAPGSSIGVQAPADLLGGQPTAMWKDTITGSDLGSSFDIGIGGAGVRAPDLLSQTGLGAMPQVGRNIQGLGSSMGRLSSIAEGGIRPDLLSRPIGEMVKGKATPFKTLFESFRGLEKGIDEESLMGMLMPQLLEQWFGGG